MPSPNSELLSPKEKRNFLFLGGLTLIAIILVVVYVVVPTVFNILRPPKAVPPPVTQKLSSAPAQIFNWVGKITKMEGEILTIENSQDPNQPKKKVTVTPATAITKLTFTPVITNGQKRYTPQETSVKVSSLKVGLTVEILAGVDISHLDEFPAVQIRVLP